MKKIIIYTIGCMAIVSSVMAEIPSFVGDLNNKFICAIFRCDSEGYSSTNQLTSEYSAQNINSINERNVKELDEEQFYQLLQNSPNISEKQIRYLWELFISNEVDSKVKILFYDFLSFETPNYLINEIITQAKNEHGELRHKLLVLLQSIYQQNRENNEMIGINEILDYFKELQSQELNKDDAGIVYRGLVTLAPKDINTKTANMTNMNKIDTSILNIKNNPKNEIKYVREIIYNLEHPDDRLVVTASYKYITELLINSDLSFLSANSKQLFREHLENKSMFNNNQSMIYPSALIEFKAALNANNSEEIYKLIHDYLELADPKNRDKAFYGLTDLTKEKLKQIYN